MPTVAWRVRIAPVLPPVADDAHRCSFLTNDCLVLLCVARDPDLRVRDIARAVGITERATQAILRDLNEEGYLERTRTGRRNHYEVRRDARLRQPLVAEHTIGTLIDAFDDGATDPSPPPRLVY
jgi:predicted ArsR family transcriptional regulator